MRTPGACREGSQVWSAKRDTPGAGNRNAMHAESVQGALIPAPFQGAIAHDPITGVALVSLA